MIFNYFQLIVPFSNKIRNSEIEKYFEGKKEIDSKKFKQKFKTKI